MFYSTQQNNRLLKFLLIPDIKFIIFVFGVVGTVFYFLWGESELGSIATLLFVTILASVIIITWKDILWVYYQIVFNSDHEISIQIPNGPSKECGIHIRTSYGKEFKLESPGELDKWYKSGFVSPKEKVFLLLLAREYDPGSEVSLINMSRDLFKEIVDKI